MSLAAVVCLAASVSLGLVYPVFLFPAPTGPNKIGTLVYHLTDPNPRSQRELMVQVWYPADPAPGAPATFYREFPRLTLPWKMRHLALVKTHAVQAAPVASRELLYPVVIYCPSWSGQRVQNTFLVEYLVSHGFVVIGIDHPYGSGVTIFPDGRVIRANLGASEDYSSEKVFQAFLRVGEEQVRLRAADVRLVLDQLAEIDRKDPNGVLTGRLDCDRVGVLGYSLGGAVAAEACLLDSRLKAGVNLDGLMFGNAAREGVPRPFLFVFEQGALPATPALAANRDEPRGRMAVVDQMEEKAVHATLDRFGGYTVSIRGTTHQNFSDMPLISPLRFLTGVGSIDPRRAMDITSAYTLAFLSKFVCGRPAPLLEGASSEYSEVKLEITLPGSVGNRPL